jgi:Peptidase family M48
VILKRVAAVPDPRPRSSAMPSTRPFSFDSRTVVPRLARAACALAACAGCQSHTAPPAQPQQAYAPPPPAYGTARPAYPAYGYAAPYAATGPAPAPAPAYSPAPAPTTTSWPGPYATAYPPNAPAPAPTYAPAPAPSYAPAPTYAPTPTYAPAPQSARPLLGPLLGPVAWQAEARAVVRELVATLPADYQTRVVNVPVVIDPNPNDVNAYASCDDKGAPLVTATEGLLDSIDAIAETKATDELFGTSTYEAYASQIAPRLASKGGGNALLPPTVIAPQYWVDARRISRAHEIFDETVAFTFGHELSHHYLGHTGCAMGQAGALPQAMAQLGQFLTSGPASFNQPNEVIADNFGARSTLDAGLARSAKAYAWTEQGGLMLLDFFEHLSRASGAGPVLSIFLSHPDPLVRIPLVQAAAASWRVQHPAR